MKAIIKSTLGGNLRLRVPNAMKLSTGGTLKTATGKNAILFFR
jgi:alpha-L-fucosidase 2